MANEQVQVTVGVNAAGVQQGMGQVGQAAQRAGQQAAAASRQAATATNTWQQSLGRLRAQARLFGADIVGRFTAAYGAMALVDKAIAAMNDNLQRSGDIAKASRKAGLGAEDYQRVARIAEETGSSVDEAAAAAGRYAAMIRSAADGNADAIESLRNLGFSEQQVRKGNISAIEVLARLSKQYREAANEAERLRIARESGVPVGILEAGPAGVVMSGSGGVRGAARVESQAAEREVAGRPGGFWEGIGNAIYEAFVSERGTRTSNILGAVGVAADESALFRGTAAQAGAAGVDTYGIRGIQAAMGREGITDEERQGLENKLKEAFARFSDDFRVAFTGTTQGGVLQTRAMVEEELQRKFVEMFPQYGAPPGANVGPVGKAAGPDGMATAVSSMQAIGGGGGFYAGATDMVSLATRTADATEAIAKNTERLLAQKGGEPTAQPVYISR